jgi:hypothetical protein
VAWDRLNLPEIEAALAALGAAPREAIDPSHNDERLTPDSLRRLGEGYRYVDELLAAQVEIFRYGQSRHILELNHRVLCGTNPERRRQFADHITETEHWFYDRPGEGIAAFSDWQQRHKMRPPLMLAAGIFVQTISRPQLFIEGNQRTATLLASYVLARAGLPPMVATAEVYPRYRALAERCVAMDRAGLAAAFTTTTATARVADFLRETADQRFLLRESRPAGSS